MFKRYIFASGTIFLISMLPILFHIVQVDGIIEKDIPPPDDIFTLIQGHLTISAGLIGAASSIILTIIGAVRWLKKQVLTENIKIKEETTRQISENKKHIENVETNLCKTITYETNSVKIELKDQKEVLNDVKKIVEKMDNKMDKNTEAAITNTAELKDHDRRILSLEKSRDEHS